MPLLAPCMALIAPQEPVWRIVGLLPYCGIN